MPLVFSSPIFFKTNLHDSYDWINHMGRLLGLIETELGDVTIEMKISTLDEYLDQIRHL